MADFLLLSHPRSGSSALRHELNRFASVVIPPEASFATWLLKNPMLLEAEKSPGRASFAEVFAAALFKTRKFEHWNLPEVALSRRLQSSGATSLESAISEIYCLYRDCFRPEASAVGDKNNSYFFEVDLALRALAPSKVLLLWRDPVEVWSSYQRLRREVAANSVLRDNPYFPQLPATLEEFIQTWTVGHEVAIECLDEWAGPVEYCSYLSFVSDGVSIPQKLVKFVSGGPARNPVNVPAELQEPGDYSSWKSGVGRPVHRRESQASAENVSLEDASEIREHTRVIQQRLQSHDGANR